MAVILAAVVLLSVGEVSAKQGLDDKRNSQSCDKFKMRFAAPPKNLDYKLRIITPPEHVDYKAKIINPCREEQQMIAVAPPRFVPRNFVPDTARDFLRVLPFSFHTAPKQNAAPSGESKLFVLPPLQLPKQR